MVVSCFYFSVFYHLSAIEQRIENYEETQSLTGCIYNFLWFIKISLNGTTVVQNNFNKTPPTVNQRGFLEG